MSIPNLWEISTIFVNPLNCVDFAHFYAIIKKRGVCKMITRLDNETSKQYQAICDFWRLGPGRNMNQLLNQYKEQENPPVKTYLTLKRWYDDLDWENRIAQNIEDEQKLIEEAYQEALIENTKRQFSILDDMYELSQNMYVDSEDVSVNQATGLYKALLESIGRIFNLNSPIKIAPTTPDGKHPYEVDTSWETAKKLLEKLALDDK